MISSRILLGGTFFVFVAVIGAAFFTLPHAAPAPAAMIQTSPASASTQTTSASGSYTLATVAKHNNATSCWAAINGNVYDLTAWINQHPGGPDKIVSICGTDGSAAFNRQHGGQARPASELKSFLLGPLAH